MPKRKLIRSIGVACCCLVFACGSNPDAEALIDADTQVRGQSTRLRVGVRKGSGEWEYQERDINSFEWPSDVDIDDLGRNTFDIDVVASLMSGKTLRYLQTDITQPFPTPINIFLDAACIDVSCGEGLSCRNGQCEDSSHPTLTDKDGGVATGPAPLARWRLEEAASGRAISTLRDERPDPVHLDMQYAGASPNWGSSTDGRFLSFSSVDRQSPPGGARTDIGGTKLDALHGSTTVTVETKHHWQECADWDGRVFEITDGESITDSGWLSIREDAGQEMFALRFNANTAWTTARYSVGDSGCLADKPHVYHWVVDTNAIEGARIRVYIDGVRVVSTVDRGRRPEEGQTLDLGVGLRRATLGTAHTSARSANVNIWYVAVFKEALDDDTIATRARALSADDNF